MTRTTDRKIMQMESEDSQPISYWPSVSDLFMTLFIISLVFTGVLCYAFLPRSAKSTKVVVDAVGGVSMLKIIEPTNKIRRALGPLPSLPELRSDTAPPEVVGGLGFTDFSVGGVHRCRDFQAARNPVCDRLEVGEIPVSPCAAACELQ